MFFEKLIYWLLYIKVDIMMYSAGMLELDGLISNSTSTSSQSSLESDKNSPKQEEVKTEQVQNEWLKTIRFVFVNLLVVMIVHIDAKRFQVLGLKRPCCMCIAIMNILP